MLKKFPMKRLIAGLSRLSKPWTTFLVILSAGLVGWFDFVTGYDFHVTGFYIIPIGWACWAMGRTAGLFMAAVCTVIFATADLASGHNYAHPAVPTWNAVMMLALFFGMVYGLTELKDEIAQRERANIEKLRVERMLERQEKLASLGTLTAGIAHEIRNPLTSLKARLYTLEKHLKAVPAARKDTDIISAEISRLEGIVQDILSFAQPSDPKLKTIAADTLLREVQGLMSTSLEKRGVQLVVDSSPGLLIRADSGKLKQVLVNLVRNGAEAIDGAGTVVLRTRAARAPLGGRETDAVILEVADDGKGIPPDVEKRLFDPFFTTKENGTGLGLPIAARIVDKHGGMLQHQSQPGHGTTFGVVLPREINETAASANYRANSPH